ncbi:heterokaryon incompatibility protein-domain-containing protein [Cladorrhinum sp. PSN332]|nr:heterokaryon incompatibility protein-domain-containing protein [Cladorrhinum sp. PSN332]
MPQYTYHPLTDDNEIRVLRLMPGSGPDELCGQMLHLRIPRTAIVGNEEAHHVWNCHFTKRLIINALLAKNENREKAHLSLLWVYTANRTEYTGIQYDAISYTWGGQTKTSGISIAGSHLPITPNLFHALSTLRTAYKPRYIWADAICINQEDTNERNHQVRMMQRIYSQASSVIVWLGNVTPSAAMTVRDLIMPFNCLSQTNEQQKILPYPEAALVGLRGLFRQPWWKRIWIIQEVVAAREIVVFYGNEIIPWSFLRVICRAVQLEEFRTQSVKGGILRGCRYRKFTALDNFRKHRTLPLIRLLQGTRDYDASDPRDKLYALLGMALDVSTELLVPDYSKSAETVFRNLVEFMITSRRSLDIISSGRLALAAPGQPTWLPDWRVPDSLRPLVGEENGNSFYRVCGDTRATIVGDWNPRVLTVDGVVADRVDCMGGALKLAHESLPTIQRWYYIAGQTPGVESLALFRLAIIAEKDNLGNFASYKFASAFDDFMDGRAKHTPAVQFYADAVTRALGDRIVVLKGCSAPLIMRGAGDDGHAVLVGESYISGIMRGEVMDGVAKGKYKVQTIRLK